MIIRNEAAVAEVKELFPNGPPSRSHPSMIDDGVNTLLSRFCRRPDLLRAAFDRQPRRVKALRDKDVLCRRGEPASEFWIIVDGQIRVEKASYALWRQPGEVVGEAELYQVGPQRRGSTLSACGDTLVFRIDRHFVEGLTDAEVGVWHETMARVLASKLDQAAIHRDRLRDDKLGVDELVSRFVCADGREAAFAALAEGPGSRIEPEACQAIVWFSDLTGFSALAETLDLRQASTLVRDVMVIQEHRIHAQGGQIDKYMGDGIMAFWRCAGEEQLDEAANAAVSAALACAEEVSKLLRLRRLPCDVRIGLNGGPVVIGDFAGDDRIAYTLIGQTVNAASRYEQAGSTTEGVSLGRVRISPFVYERLRHGKEREAFDPGQRRFLDKHSRPFPVFCTRD